MDEFYVQLEVQVDAQGTKSVIPLVFDRERAALAKHFLVLSVAAESALPYHASYVIRSDGVTTEGRVFKNGVEQEE